jgi:zinc transport system permease protein
MFKAILTYQFMQNAALAALLGSVVCGIMGVIIIEKKLVMMSGGIAHTSYGGVGLGYLLGIEPIFGAFLFSVLAALGIGALKRRDVARSDVLISLFWALGMACGILFIAMMEGYPPDISAYLFGSILSVTRADLLFILCLTVTVAVVFIALYADWQVFLFDEDFARTRGVNTKRLDTLLMVLIAVTVVVLIRVVGIILVLALLTAPAATAALFTTRLKTRVWLAIGISALYSFGGLWLSYRLNIASGAAIVMLAVVCYLLALFVVRLKAGKCINGVNPESDSPQQ